MITLEIFRLACGLIVRIRSFELCYKKVRFLETAVSDSSPSRDIVGTDSSPSRESKYRSLTFWKQQIQVISLLEKWMKLLCCKYKAQIEMVRVSIYKSF
jgi:hypothetical protein